MQNDNATAVKRLSAEAADLLNAQNVPDAIACLEQALSLAPEDTHVRFKLAQCLKRVGRRDEARRLTDTLLVGVSLQADWLALAAELSENADIAIELLTKALKMAPERPAWAIRLSKLHYQKREIGAAAAAIRTLPLASFAPNWCSYIAMCLWRSGDPGGAREAIQRAMEDPQAQRSTLEAMEAEIVKQTRESNSASNIDELSSAFYDKSYSGAKLYALDAKASSYLRTWNRIVGRIREHHARSALDIGCGPGQFAEFLQRELPDIAYTGVDFSEVAISMAKQRCPELRFLVHDVVRGDALDIDYDVVICTEVLEHITNDLAVFANLKVGSFFIGTVPDFDSFGHVRYFASEEEVRDRYASRLDRIEVEKVVVNERAALFIVSGMVRPGAVA